MADRTFRGLMTHRCTIVFAKRTAPTPGTGTGYGHSLPSFSDPEIVTLTEVRCRIDQASSRESHTMGEDGRVIADYTMFLDLQDTPDWFKQGAEADIQVSNVRIKRRNVLIATGPFLVEGIKMPGGVDHHWEVSLRKINR